MQLTMAVLSHLVLFLEFLNLSARFHKQLLAAGIKRMAFRANFHANFLFGGARHEFVAAGAAHLSLMIFGMYGFFHYFHLPSLTHRVQRHIGHYIIIELGLQ